MKPAKELLVSGAGSKPIWLLTAISLSGIFSAIEAQSGEYPPTADANLGDEWLKFLF